MKKWFRPGWPPVVCCFVWILCVLCALDKTEAAPATDSPRPLVGPRLAGVSLKNNAMPKLDRATPHPLLMPADGVVSSPFGLRIVPRARRGSRVHLGIDILAPEGSPVVAAAEGTVVSAGPRGGYGNFVEIRHPGGLVTRYAHLKEIAVSVGEDVYGGMRIGALGRTGHTTGPNLHFETIYKGRKVDPIHFVGKQKMIPRKRGGERILRIKDMK